MKKVGITGGIGSGKSIVCSIFEKIGIPVFVADTCAKNIMQYHPEIRKLLIDRFGNNVFLNKELNRPYLAQIIFNNFEAISFVNSIIHPVVEKEFEKWCLQYNYLPYVIEEAALLFENGMYKKLDVLITVFAPEALRIQRVLNRDLITSEQVLERIKNQMPDNEKIKLADFVIHNNEQQSVIEQVLNIHQNLLSLI